MCCVLRAYEGQLLRECAVEWFLMLYALVWLGSKGEPFCRFPLWPAMHQVNFIALIHSASAQLGWMDVNEWMNGEGESVIE